MSSVQAHLAVWFLKRWLKPRLRAATDAGNLRRVLHPFNPVRAPSGVRYSAGSVDSVPGEWVDARQSGLTLLYLHGGGYVACSPQTHRPITAAFAREGFRVFAPDYRLAPAHVFPAALDDALSVYRGLLAQGIDAGRMVVAGDSAGGGLALALLLALRDSRTPLPAAAALFSPWTDLAATGPSLVENDHRCALFHGDRIGSGARFYLGDADPRNPLVSPLYGDFANLPPLLIHVGEDEVLRDDSTRVAQRARAAGVNVEIKLWPVVPHVWQIAAPFLPEARRSLREAAAFLRLRTR